MRLSDVDAPGHPALVPNQNSELQGTSRALAPFRTSLLCLVCQDHGYCEPRQRHIRDLLEVRETHMYTNAAVLTQEGIGTNLTVARTST